MWPMPSKMMSKVVRHRRSWVDIRSSWVTPDLVRCIRCQVSEAFEPTSRRMCDMIDIVDAVVSRCSRKGKGLLTVELISLFGRSATPLDKVLAPITTTVHC